MRLSNKEIELVAETRVWRNSNRSPWILVYLLSGLAIAIPCIAGNESTYLLILGALWICIIWMRLFILYHNEYKEFEKIKDNPPEINTLTNKEITTLASKMALRSVFTRLTYRDIKTIPLMHSEYKNARNEFLSRYTIQNA